MPNKTLADKNIADIKNHKDRLNICVNADGSDKPKLCCISKLKKARCFSQGFNSFPHTC